MATKKKAPSQARPKKAAAQPSPVAPAAVQAPAAPAQKPADWRMIVGLLVLAFIVTKVWDMRHWQEEGFKFGSWSKPEVAVATFKGAVAERGSGPNEVLGCLTMTMDKDGDVFYYYGAGLLKKFSRDNKLLAAFSGDSQKEKISLWSLAAAPDGSLWAIERGGSRFLQFDSKLKLVKKVDSEVAGMYALAIDSQGRFLVTVPGGFVQALDEQGKLLSDIGHGGKMALVQGTRLTVDGQDNIYVLDKLDSKDSNPADPMVRCYDKTGKPLAQWVARGLPWNMFSCIAYDPQGYVVLNNNGQSESQGLQVYTKDGSLRCYVQTTSSGITLSVVSGLAISADGDWAVDVSPAGRGCDRLRLPSLSAK
jgi:hypothetical protein